MMTSRAQRNMNRSRSQVLAIASLFLGVLIVMPARAASLTQVSRSTWGASGVPSYVEMYIYVPDKLATKPPIVVSAHSCGSSAAGQMGNIPKFKAAADTNGLILILPDNPGQNCWDVGSSQSLKHDGGGDTQAVAQMVTYALSKYSGDASRVYIFGGSSGGMMTQAMLAVYPDVFRAGTARAGVPAGCWADGYTSSNQWSNNCAGGNTTKTAQQWGDLVRAMDPSYSGHRPRVQTMQGEADATISYNNTAEAIKEWTNVLGLSTAPTSTDTGYKAANATYDRQFWKNACGYTVFEAWSSPGGTHSMAYEEADIMKFFGLDTAGGSDPEPDCSGDGGVAGTGGVSGSGGATGSGGAGGAKDGGSVGRDGGSDVTAGGGAQGGGGSADSGGAQGSGGALGTGGGAAATGGHTGSGGTSSSGGSTGSGGVVGGGGSLGDGGSSAKGGSGGQGSGGAPGKGGSVSPGGTYGTGGSTSVGTTSGGCSCTVGRHAGRSTFQVVVALGLATLGLVVRRQRRAHRPSRVPAG